MLIKSNGPEETEQVGKLLVKRLNPGSVVAFSGDLGAGKTAFVRGMAAGLGIKEPVTSPTFTIVNEYVGPSLPLFHFDLYRLTCDDDLYDIGWEDYLLRGGICAVEWSENAPSVRENAVTVKISKSDTNDNQRVIEIKGIESFENSLV